MIWKFGDGLRGWVYRFLRGGELREARRLARRMERLRGQVEGLLRRADNLLSKVDKCREDIQRLREEISSLRYEDNLEALRARIDVLENVMVPGLVTSHQLLVKEMESRIAVEAHRQAMLSGAIGSGGEAG